MCCDCLTWLNMWPCQLVVLNRLQYSEVHLEMLILAGDPCQRDIELRVDSPEPCEQRNSPHQHAECLSGRLLPGMYTHQQ